MEESKPIFKYRVKIFTSSLIVRKFNDTMNYNKFKSIIYTPDKLSRYLTLCSKYGWELSHYSSEITAISKSDFIILKKQIN